MPIHRVLKVILVMPNLKELNEILELQVQQEVTVTKEIKVISEELVMESDEEAGWKLPVDKIKHDAPSFEIINNPEDYIK